MKNSRKLPIGSTVEHLLLGRWISKRDLASALGVSVSFINKYMRLGLPYQKFGRLVRFQRAEVDSFFTKSSCI